MSWLIPLVLLFGAGTAAASLTQNWNERGTWVRVGARLGLTLVSSWPAPLRLSGTIRGFDIAVTRSRLGKIVVQVLDIDPWFTLEEKGPSARMDVPPIDIDGWGFDEMMRVCGDRDFALGLLTMSTRAAADKVVLDLGGEVAEGKVSVPVRSIHSAPEAIGPMLCLAEALRRPTSDELPPLLAHNALEDVSKVFRFQCFQQLVREFSGTPEVLQTARQLLGDSDGELRLEAAVVLLDREDDPLHRVRTAEALFDLAARHDVEVELRCSALDAMVRSEVSGKATALASGILDDLEEPREMREHALVVLAQAKAVHELLAVETVYDGAERARLVWALGQCGDVAAQPRLLEMLSHRDEHIRLLAIDSLGAVGDAEAVHPLRRLAGEKTLIQTPVARRVEEAVLQIRHRLGGSQAGEISIVDPEPLEGAVSVAEGEREGPEGGEVSLA